MLRRLSAVVLAVAIVVPACASKNLEEIAGLVVSYGEASRTAAGDVTVANYDEPTGLVRDVSGSLNVAEASLNYAAALLETGAQPERAARVIAAVLEQQDRAEGSPTYGLFRWTGRAGAVYSANATLYLAPALAHLARELSDGGGVVGDLLGGSVQAALDGLLANPTGATDGFAAGMYAGAVCTLGDAAGDARGPEAGRETIAAWLKQVSRAGLISAPSPTYDALRIGGLRWAWQFAADDEAKGEAEMALQVCYRDLLSRYDANAGMVGGPVLAAYPADYNGDPGVARSLLAADLTSALERLPEAVPLAMYFALAEYELGDALVALVDGREAPGEVRTRIPSVEDPLVEVASSCTWASDLSTMGTMSGPVSRWSIPVLMTFDLPRRQGSYFYAPDIEGHVQSVQAGSLALCSFTFDGVGVADRKQVRVRGVLGCVPEVDTVLVNGVEWIGEPAAVGSSGTIVLQRGSSFLGVKILETGAPGGRSEAKPGILTHIGEGDDRSVVLEVYGRQEDYSLRKPVHNVRVGLLIETSPAAEWEDLAAFARHISSRRVRQTTKNVNERAPELEDQGNPLHRHDPKSRAEMRFITRAEHTMQLRDEELPLGLAEDMSARAILSRTLPVELSPKYLWASPGLNLDVGGSLSEALGQ